MSISTSRNTGRLGTYNDKVTGYDETSNTYGETIINNPQTVIMGNVYQHTDSSADPRPRNPEEDFELIHRSLLFEGSQHRVNNVKRPSYST